jgi:hypothetical protein
MELKITQRKLKLTVFSLFAEGLLSSPLYRFLFYNNSAEKNQS